VLAVVVVPARGGSKGIPRKDLCKVGGRSLIAHVARTPRALDWIDRAVLATDHPERAEEGPQHGLEVPFLRPAVFASDNVDPYEVGSSAMPLERRRMGRQVLDSIESDVGSIPAASTTSARYFRISSGISGRSEN